MQGGGPTIEVPVVAFPLRGRINPYFWFLFPMFGCSLAAFLLSLGSLLGICLAPVGSAGFKAAPGIYQAAIVVAIIIYSLTLALSALMAGFYIFIFFNIFDTAYAQVLIDIINVVTIILFIVVSAIAIAAEASLPAAVFGVVVYQYAILTAGILGFSASFCLIAALFFSRFYEYCIGNYKHQKREILKAAELATQLNNPAGA